MTLRYNSIGDLMRERDEARAEVELLTRQRDDSLESVSQLSTIIGDLGSEVERLLDEQEFWRERDRKAQERLAALGEQNERLRAALDDCVCSHPERGARCNENWAACTARRALDGEISSALRDGGDE